MQSEEYKRGYENALRRMDRYNLYRRFIRPVLTARNLDGDRMCVLIEKEENWYPETDFDDLVEKYKSTNTNVTKLCFEEKYVQLYTVRNLKEEIK